MDITFINKKDRIRFTYSGVLELFFITDKTCRIICDDGFQTVVDGDDYDFIEIGD